MPLFSHLRLGLAALIGAAAPALAGPVWTSPHLTIEKFATWSEFLDVLDQPHINMTVRNDGTEAIGSYSFSCRLHLLDRATPIFQGTSSTVLDYVVRPSESRTVKLAPNMFSDLGEVIQHHYDNASWSCYVSRILTASGRSISFEPGQLPTDGPPFGVGYSSVPPAMAALLKVPSGTGMWVLKVQPGSAAEVSGLKAGDVILAIDGRELRAVPDLPEALRTPRQASQSAHLSVVRAGRSLDIEASMPEAPPSVGALSTAGADPGPEGH